MLHSKCDQEMGRIENTLFPKENPCPGVDINHRTGMISVIQAGGVIVIEIVLYRETYGKLPS